MSEASRASGVPESKNFGFLESHDEVLVVLGAAAERYFVSDPVICLIKCRLLGEALAQQAAAQVGLCEARRKNARVHGVRKVLAPR